MEFNSFNPTLKQTEIEKKLVMSKSTLQRYRHDMNLLSAFRNLTITNKRRQKVSSDDSN